MGKGNMKKLAGREYTIVGQALKVYHKTGSHEAWLKFVTEACEGNNFLATDVCKKVEYRIWHEDTYDF